MRQLPADKAGGGGSGFLGLLHNGAFVAAFLGFFFAQSAKVFTHFYTERKWDFTRLVSSGGMPSSHTALVSGPPLVWQGISWSPSCRHAPELPVPEATAACCWLIQGLWQHGWLRLTRPGFQPCSCCSFASPLPPWCPARASLALPASAQVMGLTTAIGVLEGTNHPMFAIALVFSLIVSPTPCCAYCAALPALLPPAVRLLPPLGCALCWRARPAACQAPPPAPHCPPPPVRLCTMPAGCGCTRASRPACST